MDAPERFLHLPYEQRWEPLKPAIIRIYIEEKATLAQLVKRMADEFSFKAETHQYRYHFKRWGIKKRTTTVEKEAIVTALGKRSRQPGIGTSNVTLEQGGLVRAVDKKQLKRHLNDSIRKERPTFLRPGLFLDRDLPYSALVRRFGAHDRNHPSPPSNGPPTPGYLAINSPENQSPSALLREGRSPTTQLLHEKVLMDRAQLLLHGREVELMMQMDKDERKVTADWFHDFWMFSFITTKYWGRGPKNWTLSMIDFKTFAGAVDPSSPGNPLRWRNPAIGHYSPMVLPRIEAPTQLCRWSIHYEEQNDYERIHSPPNSPTEDGFDIDDESTWREWDDEPAHDLTDTMIQGLQDNAFSRIQSDDLPLATTHIVDAISRPPAEPRVEALGFAIMSRNVDVLFDLLSPDSDRYKGYINMRSIRNISPYHLAAKFLDGSGQCCNVMFSLLEHLGNDGSIAVNYTDHSGLTVLDTLFVSILRSHSSTPPVGLGGSLLTDGSYFKGGDVDVCGRWDADSPCIRHLHASGETAIPQEWKHVFCHTSAQAVCHSITAVFMSPYWAPNINTASGLFKKRCPSCGLELQLGPLHALVFMGYHLANFGMPGETLFGVLACLACLLTLKADPSTAVEISIPAILGNEESAECQHRIYNAAELASALPAYATRTWTAEVILGWESVKELLKHRLKPSADGLDGANESEDGSEEGDASEDDTLANEYCPHLIHDLEDIHNRALVECGDKRLGTIWAAVQVELLTYRRLGEADPWLSPYFDMQTIVAGLQEAGDSILGRLIRSHGEGALGASSLCGLFLHAWNPGCVRREEACTSYFANLDDWKRTSFIQVRNEID